MCVCYIHIYIYATPPPPPKPTFYQKIIACAVDLTNFLPYFLIRRPWGACWMVAEGGEGENPLPFSLTAPKRGGGGGGGRGGIPASFPSRSPPPKQPFQPTPTPSPGSRQEVCEKSEFERFGWFLWGKGPRPLVGRAPGPGPKPPGDLAHRCLGPGSRHSHRFTSCRVSKLGC